MRNRAGNARVCQIGKSRPAKPNERKDSSGLIFLRIDPDNTGYGNIEKKFHGFFKHLISRFLFRVIHQTNGNEHQDCVPEGDLCFKKIFPNGREQFIFHKIDQDARDIRAEQRTRQKAVFDIRPFVKRVFFAGDGKKQSPSETDFPQEQNGQNHRRETEEFFIRFAFDPRPNPRRQKQ